MAGGIVVEEKILKENFDFRSGLFQNHEFIVEILPKFRFRSFARCDYDAGG